MTQTVSDTNTDPNLKNLIQTVSGIWFDPIDPDPAAIDIQDIAHALANNCRFTGHVTEFYSVAQHSVLVSELLEVLYNADHVFLQWGLLHDASEAYLSDLARPIKQQEGLGSAYRAVEDVLHEAVATRFDLPWPMPDLVKEADYVLLRTEQRDLMPDHSDYAKGEPKIIPWTPAIAKDTFLARYNELFS